MGIISLEFLIFTAAVILAYYLFPVKKYQWTVLLAASVAYYFINCNKYTVYIAVTTVTTYFGALLIEKLAQNGKRLLNEKKDVLGKEERKELKNKIGRRKRAALAAVLVFNFGILAALKYLGFCADAVRSLLGMGEPAEAFSLVVPLGISFYTFQSMGYVIDVYRGKVSAQRNFGKLALFVSFFPQIIQGPIGIYSDLANQLYEPRRFEYERFKSGLLLILWGVFKKLLIADRTAGVISLVAADCENLPGTYSLLAVLLYAAQLYADFSGGIDICRGIAEILGITMAENFKRPYFSKTLTEYWHRWHVSLGDWLRNYLFYPISISKPFLKMGKSLKKHGLKHFGKVFPTALASLITFVVIGIWHGAESKYVAFGLWNGLVIMVSSLMKPLTDKVKINRESAVYRIFAMFRTFLLVLVGYYFDVAKSFTRALEMLWGSVADFSISDFSGFLFMKNTGIAAQDYVAVLIGCVTIFVVSVIEERKQTSVRSLLAKRSTAVQWILYLMLVISTVLLGYYGPGTTPADFIYMQF